MRRGDILKVDLGQPTGGGGHEQSGVRPVVAISLCDEDPSNPMITLVPFTGKLSKANYPHTIVIDPTIENGLTRPSILMVFQVVSLDKRRVIEVIGRLEDEKMRELEKTLRRLMGL